MEMSLWNKYYDVVISLGQYCITSTALRRCKLQRQSMPFDWSAGIIEEKCGKGGLAGKVDLICNDFENFFNKEDFENWGNNQENDTYNLWIVNTRTGLQYKHDFPASVDFNERFSFVKEQYLRRANRLKIYLKKSKRVLFVYMARDEGFSNDYLLDQYYKIKSSNYRHIKCELLYIMHDSKKAKDEYNITYLNKNVCRIDMNFTYSEESYPESWNGNTRVYYSILEKFFISKDSLYFQQEEIKELFKSLKEEFKKFRKSLKKFLKMQIAKLLSKAI